MKSNLKQTFARILVIGLLAEPLLSGSASAAGALSNRNAVVSTSAAAATGVTYTVHATLGTSGQTLGAIKFEICDSPVLTTACAGTGGSSGASLGSVTLGSVSGLGGSWSAGSSSGASSSGTSLVIHKATAAVESGTPAATIVLNNVTNPSTANSEYFLRISTYSDTSASTPAYPGTDFGAIALDTANQVTVSGTMPESLVFCVGTSGTNCGNITGTSVNLGTFSPTASNAGTSVMSASTNAGSGYAITINGTTMTSGANTIAAMGTQSANSSGCVVSCTSSTGTGQFGTNVRANSVATAGGAFGADVSGAGTATGAGGFNTANSFRFFTGDTVASVSGVTNSNLFTNSYLVNVGGAQAAGLYTATLTYICTATF